MALVRIGVSSEDTPLRQKGDIVTVNGYKCYKTEHVGIFEIVNKKGYLVRLDYGRVLKLDKKTSKYQYKQDKTNKKVDTLKEALKLRAEAVIIREKRKNGEEIQIDSDKSIHKVTMSDVIDDFKESIRYMEMSDSYKNFVNNYSKHILDYFAGFEPSRITSVDVEKYFLYQREFGKSKSPKSNGGTKNKQVERLNKPNGISINTIYKHKSVMKIIWEFMIESKKYGVTENVILHSKVPRQTVYVDGKAVLVKNIKYNARSLTLEELNYTINDALQNELDSNIALIIALAAIGGLRRSEITALKVGRVLHNELMDISKETFDYGGYDIEYYKQNHQLMFIDEAIVRIEKREILKLPKGDKVRAVAIPNCLKEIIDFALEQKKEILTTLDRELKSSDQICLPLVNILDNRELKESKVGRKWDEYQKRRSKRMKALGLEPIPHVRLHDLRHTHSNLLKIDVPTWEISCNMGHLIPDSNTTKKVYWNDRQPYRQHIIDYFDNNIHIEWNKVMRRSINSEDAILHVNNSGQLKIKNEHKERIKQLKGKLILTEEEIAEMIYLEEHTLIE